MSRHRDAVSAIRYPRAVVVACSRQIFAKEAVNVEDVMTAQVLTFERNTSLMTAIDAMASKSVSMAPVLDADKKVIGVLSETDLLPIAISACGESDEYLVDAIGRSVGGIDVSSATVGDLMAKRPVVADEGTTLPQAARTMMANKVHVLPVVSKEGGALLGVISRGDIIGRSVEIMNRPVETNTWKSIDE